MLVAHCGALAIRMIARRPECVPHLPAQPTPERVRVYFTHLAQG
ncbi:hypothetical protein [Verminephrobacter eiseniae]|nr:hypothetical protein [Verminephrobacter eiseniae]